MRFLRLVTFALCIQVTFGLLEGWVQKGLGAMHGGLGMLENAINTVTGQDSIRTIYKKLFGLDVSPDPDEMFLLSVPSNLQTVSLEDFKHYVHFAAAAYCEGAVLSSYTCNECKLTGEGNVEMIQVVKNSTLDTQGYVAVDDPRQEIVVTFRGSHNPTNWLSDFTFDKIKSPLKDGAQIHQGFYEATESLQGQVSYVVQSQLRRNPNYRVVFTGHSLGGSMAVLSYYLLSAELPTLNYAVITFGEPRAGDQQFADIINSRSIPFARVVNEGDLAPHTMVWSLGFVHHGIEYWTSNGVTRMCSNQVYEDLTCSASLPLTKFIIADHLDYLDTSIGLNCIEENPIQGLLGMITG